MKFIKYLNNMKLDIGQSVLLNIILCIGMLTSMLFSMCDSDMWNYDRKSIVIEKDMYEETNSKGKIHDDAYLKVRWDDNREEEWIHARTLRYLNTEIGDVYIDRVQKSGFAYFMRRFIGIFMTLSFLVWWSYRLAMCMP